MATSGTDTPNDPSVFRRRRVLSDGTGITVRAIRASDRPALRRAFHRLSSESVALRFMMAKRDLTEAELSYFTAPDFGRHVALVATLGEEPDEEIIGVGRYFRLDEAGRSERAELALAVIDEFQGRGVGSVLLEEIAWVARGSGVTHFEADVASGNKRVLKMFEHAGYDVVQRQARDGTLHVAFPLCRAPDTKGETRE